MTTNSSRVLSVSIATALLAACGGGSDGSSGVSGTSSTSTAPPTTAAPQTASVPVMVSDASTEDWATIGVKILSIALVPQGGGSNVTVYTAPSPAPTTNLVELDQISEILGNASVPVGTYTSAVLTVSGNASDILLTASADPEAGFAAQPGATIPAAQIQVQHTQGSGANLTVPITVNFASALSVSTTQNNALDLEFDLAHPAFIIGHVPPTSGGTTLWAVNFDGPVRHRPVHALNRLVLRHTYGSVTAISTDNTSITILKEFATEPVVDPETAVAGTESLQILADATNGTLFYDLDAGTKTVIKDFSAESALLTNADYVRVAARYQEDGTLVATRIWASTSFNKVWVSPEGHVLHVNPTTGIVTVQNESGAGVDVMVGPNTNFYFRQPWDAVADATAIGMGTSFLTNHDLIRGFKVHVSVVDPLAATLTADTIDIETAKYDGTISASGMAGFTYTHDFRTASDDYLYTLAYISGATANGTDDSGNPITGFKWWNFAYPTLLTSGTNAVTAYIAATDGSVNFGGTAGAVPTYGQSFTLWADPANPTGWSAYASIVMPSRLPLGTVTTALSGTAFTMMIPGAAMAATIDVGTATGSSTLVYQVDRTNGIVTVSPVDVTTSAGLATLTAGLTAGATVRVYGVPQGNGSLQAYVLTYFTGEMPGQ